MKDAPTLFRKEESASSMGQLANFAVMKDAQIRPSRVESVGGMEPRRGQLSKHAATKDALNMPREEVSVGCMEQLQKPAITRDAPTTWSKEGSASSTEQRRLKRNAATENAPTKSTKEESVSGMGQLPKPAVMRDAPTAS